MAKLVECVPNFSVSREKDPAVFQGLVDTANSIPGCFVFDVQSDGNHNRCVFTLLGSPEAMGEAAFQLTKKATETIDEIKHIVETLEDTGFAYEAGGDVLFRTKKEPGYGKLSHQPLEELESTRAWARRTSFLLSRPWTRA